MASKHFQTPRTSEKKCIVGFTHAQSMHVGSVSLSWNCPFWCMGRLKMTPALSVQYRNNISTNE